MHYQATLLPLQRTMQRQEIKVVTKRVEPVTSAITEMTEIVRAAAEPWAPGDSVKAGINRASRSLRLSPRLTTTFWYGRSAAVLADEADRMRAWYRAYCDREAERLESRAAELRTRQRALGDKRHGIHLADAGRNHLLAGGSVAGCLDRFDALGDAANGTSQEISAD